MDSSDETPQLLFARVLGVEPDWAALLVTTGFTTLEQVAYIPIDEFRSIDGLDEQQIQAWRSRARRHLLVSAIGGGDEEDPLATATGHPPRPTSGGSSVTLDDDEAL